jgi:hypothetical protein
MRLLTKTERYALHDAVRAEMARRQLTAKALSDLTGLKTGHILEATTPNGNATGRLVEIARALGVQA